MNYTCENCKYRNTWDCEDCWGSACEDFKLDEDTLNEEERRMLRVLRQVIRENNYD
jgi:hypothetical protein